MRIRDMNHGQHIHAAVDYMEQARRSKDPMTILTATMQANVHIQLAPYAAYIPTTSDLMGNPKVAEALGLLGVQ